MTVFQGIFPSEGTRDGRGPQPHAAPGRPRDFLLGKLHTARYVAAWELPRTAQHADLLGRLDDTLTTMCDIWF